MLVPPPFFEADAGPLHFQDGKSNEADGDDEEVDEEGDVEILDNEVAGEQREGGKEAVDYEEDGGEGIDANVEVGNALEDFEAGGGQEGVVAGEEDLDGARCPPEDLVETVGEVDGGGTTEGVALCDAIDRTPTTIMHAVAGDDIFSDRAINPAHSVTPLCLVLVPATSQIGK